MNQAQTITQDVKFRRLKKPSDLEQLEVGEIIYAYMLWCDRYQGHLMCIGRENGIQTFVKKDKAWYGPKRRLEGFVKYHITPTQILVHNRGAILTETGGGGITPQPVSKSDAQYKELNDLANYFKLI